MIRGCGSSDRLQFFPFVIGESVTGNFSFIEKKRAAGTLAPPSGRKPVTLRNKLGAGHHADHSLVSPGAVELPTSSTITPSLTMQISEFFTSKGRIPRSTFWIFFLVLYGIMGAVVFVIERIGASETLQVVGGLLML